MVFVQSRSKRKPSGGRYTSTNPKRKHQKGNLPSNTRIGKRDARNFRTKGGGFKKRLLSVDKVNLFNPESKKFSVAEVKNVVESPANRHFVRRNILTKGAVIETSEGKARITSKPGQEGMLNAVLIK